jgi:hypothetical protein
LKLVGVDAGVTGAVALLDTAADTIDVHDIELDGDRQLDARWLFHLLLEWEPVRLVTEDTFRVKPLLRQTGAIVAVGQILELDVHVVAVTTWKRALLGQNTNDKRLSIRCAQQLAPQAQLRKPRARTDSADRAEAVLLALYGSRLGGPCSG